MDWKPPFVDASPPATTLPWLGLLPAPPQPRVALDQINLGFVDTNRLLKTYFKFPEDEDEEDEEGDTLLKDQDMDMENELESPPLLSCNPLSPSAVPPSARTIYSVPRRPDSEAFSNRRSSPACTTLPSPSRRTVQRAPSPTVSGPSSSSTDTSVSTDFATILRAYVGSGTDDESDSDESYAEDTRAQRVDKGKGRAVEPGPALGWEANVEARDFLVDDRYLYVDPRDPEVFGVEGDIYADAEAEESGLDEDNGQEVDTENDDEEIPPTAGPSTGAAYYHGAGPITSAPVAWGTLQRSSTQQFMNEGSPALGTEQPDRLPSNIGAKRKRAANNDDRSDEQIKDVPVVPGTPLNMRLSDAALQEAYGRSTDTMSVVVDHSCTLPSPFPLRGRSYVSRLRSVWDVNLFLALNSCLYARRRWCLRSRQW